MAQFSLNRFPMESCNQNIQWNNPPTHLTGNINCVQPFQTPPTPAFRPPQHEGFPHYTGHNIPPFSNVQVHPPEFSIMLPPNNQAFTGNVNVPQNFPNAPDPCNFVRTPDPQNFPRMASPQNFQGAHNPQNFPGVPGSQNFSRAPGSQNLPGAPVMQNFPGSTPNAPNTFSGAPNPHHFPGAPIAQPFSGPPSSQHFPGAPAQQTFSGAPGPQPFPRGPGSQTFLGPPGPQNFQRPFCPQNFSRPPDPQSFSQPPDPQSFSRPSNPQNFSRPSNAQNFTHPPNPQNFSQPPGPQNFPRHPDPQNFPRNNNNSPNFPRVPNFQNFPGVPNQPNFQGDSNVHNFSRSSDSQNFPGGHYPQGMETMPGLQNFKGSPNLHHPPSGNFPVEPTFDKFSQMSGSSPRPFGPWNRFSSGGQRTQFQTRSWESNPSRQFRDYSLQENNRGTPKVRNFKKLKEDNTEKPFSCDTCDRAFLTETDLQDHISQHITCDHANCTFEAHPKIVALHKRMQHDTGYAERINRLKDAEEIRKWREERKKRFPTAENIRKRQAEQAEREARGEVLETKEFGKFKRRKEDNEMNSRVQRRGKRFKRRNDRRKNFIPRSQTFPVNDDSETDSDSDSHIKLHKFPGMLSLTNSADEGVNDIEGKDLTYPPADSSISNYSELQNPSEQNLSKSKSGDNFCQSAVPCSDSNSNNQIEDKTSHIDDDKLHDATSSSVVEISDDKSTKEQKIATVEDSDNEAPIAEPIVKCVEKSILTNGHLNGNEGNLNESVCEIPNDKSEAELKKNVEVIQVADSDDDAPAVLPINKSFENSPSVDNKPDQNKADQESLTESPKVEMKATENGYNKYNNRYSRYSRNQHNQQNGQDFVQVARKSSLLEKLLADDIRHERNVILQCIRHIVKNNFFGIESTYNK